MTDDAHHHLRTEAALLFAQKILTVKPIKGGIAVEMDPRPAWDAADRFIDEKIRRDKEKAAKEKGLPLAKPENQ